MDIKDLLKDSYREDMSVEDIISALRDVEMPADLSSEVDRLKTALSKSNSEAADYKRQLKDRMTEEERRAKEDADSREELQKNHDALLREVNISKNKSKLLALGYEDKLAEETAEAMVNGELDKVFANQKKHLESVRKELRSELLKEVPPPVGGNPSDTMTKEKLRNMSPQERYDYSVKNPEKYKEIYGGNE